jgi:sulfate transport system substrate-binding protein
VQVIVPNPKTSGNGRYTYLSAWGYVLKHGGDENKARDFVGKLFKQAPVLDTGGRAATTTFMTNQIGDVLVTFENEAEMIAREFGRDQFEVVYPSVSAEAEPPVRWSTRWWTRKAPGRGRGIPEVPVVAGSPGNRRQQLPAPA